MRSDDTFDDLSPTPISRRTVAKGIWVAPVIALTFAAPAVAASTPPQPQLSAAGTGQGTNRRWTVTFANMPANTQITVAVTNSASVQRTVQWISGGVANTTNATKTLIVTVTGSGAFTFLGHATPTGTVSGGGITNVPFS